MSDFVKGRVESDRGSGAVEPGGASSERSGRGRLLGWRAAVVGMVLLGGLGASAVAVAGPARSSLAALLRAENPGGSVPNGKTIVVTRAGATVHGARDRHNFIAALGSHETIIGGNRNDDLAALGDGVKIIGGGGNDLLYGGRDATLIGGGGRDLLTDRGANATIRAGSGDVVIAEGRHDHVLCARGSRQVTVYEGKSDSVSATCRAGGDRVLPLGRLRSVQHPARAREAAGAITGDGSNDNPFVAPCDDPAKVDCTINAFPQRTLSGVWAHDNPPAYKCPADHPYLLRQNYGDGIGVTAPRGVEVQREEVDRLGYPIAVEILGVSLVNDFLLPVNARLSTGTKTGFGDSWAGNWLWGGTHWYRVILHCTSNSSHGANRYGQPQSFD